MTEENPLSPAEPEAPHAGIVSVNSRGGSGGNLLGKVFFASGVLGLLMVAGFYGYNKYRAAKTEQEAAVKQTAKNESKPAQAGILRNFEKEQQAADLAAATYPGSESMRGGRCSDGTEGAIARGPDNMPLLTAAGVPMHVCADGHVIVPNIDSSAANGLLGAPQGGQRPSRYGGDALISGAPAAAELAGQTVGANPVPGSDPALQAAYLAQLIQQGHGANGLPAGGAGTQNGPASAGAAAAAASPPGSIGSQLSSSETPKVSAAMLGDRNMILPRGRSLDCGLSMRMVSELPGLASCILSQNVYSDNGKVLLLERGSEASGEYRSANAQGQERIFVLWTRIKTPTGVIINLDSPGSDELGTSGLPAVVNNHWWKRLGAAILLTVVQDAIAYKTAQASNGSLAGVAVYQNTAQSSNSLAEKILDSTINIKPTLYKNQGDRSAIYVARDLDFSSVYALRPR